MGEFATYLGAFAALAAAVWAATEGIGRALGVRKDLVALVLGPLGGVMLYASGFVVDPEGMRVRWAGWVAAGLCGLLATFAAAQLNDRVVKPREEARSRADAPRDDQEVD